MAEFDVPFTPPQYDVYRLGQDAATEGETVIALKLTDEFTTALEAAARKGKQRLKLVVDEQGGGSIKVENTTFRFSTQTLPTPFADAVSFQPRTGFKSTASVGLKYTIQATQNSFEETRVKAQKMLEAEKDRGTKDVNKSRNGKKTEIGRGLSGSHVAAALAHARVGSLSASKSGGSGSGTSVLGGGVGSRNASPNMPLGGNAASAQARVAVPMRGDLMKKSLRERVIHICATARYHSFDEVVGRLRKDGISPEQDSRKGIEDVLRTVSEFSESGRLILKTNCYNEVNLKWPWLSTEEKTFIRRMLNPNSAPSNFAPSRKSGVDRVMAPNGGGGGGTASGSSDKIRDDRSASSSNSHTSSPEGVPDGSPPKGSSSSWSNGSGRPGTGSGSGSGGSGSGAQKRSASPLETKDDSGDFDDELYYSSTTSSKRKAHAPAGSKTTPPSTTTVLSSTSLSSRGVRQESSSPPEDPRMAKEDPREKMISPPRPATTQVVTSQQPPPPSSASSSSTSMRREERDSRPPSVSPRTDWRTVYGPIGSSHEAETYTAEFHQSYDEYAEMHGKLSKVSAEFTEMEKRLRGCAPGSKEAEQIEAKIQSKYAYYEKDIDFIKLRNRHNDVRLKLATIRERLEQWDKVSTRS